MAIGDPISQPIPAVGSAGQTYASQLVAFLQEVKARLESNISMSSLLTGLLDMANNALENVQYLGLYESADPPAAPVGSLHRYQDELWYVGSSGGFALTSNGSLNAAALNGIGGDYGPPNPALVTYVDADSTYEFYDDEPNGVLASLRGQSFTLTGVTGGGSTEFIHPPAVTDTRQLTVGAYPASGTSLMSLAVTGGDIGTLVPAESIRATNTPQITDLDATGNTTHGDRTITLAMGSFYYFTGTPGMGVTSNTVRYSLDSGGTVYIPLPLRGGDRLKSVKVYSSTARWTAAIYSILPHTDFGEAVVAKTDADTTTLLGELERTSTVTTPFKISSGGAGGEGVMTLKLTSTATATLLYYVTVTYDRPI
jgi:hypothetical protein